MTPKEIKALRVAAGLTQEGFARATGVRVLTDGRWERGDARPSRLALEKLERFKKQFERKGVDGQR